MGIWGHRIFDSDLAFQTVGMLQESAALKEQMTMLLYDVFNDEYITWEVSVRALVCAALIDYVLHGTYVNELTTVMNEAEFTSEGQIVTQRKAWLASLRQSDITSLRTDALNVIGAIRTDREFCELYGILYDAKLDQLWQDELQVLQSNIKQASC